MVPKPPGEICFEFSSTSKLPGIDQYHFYSVGAYNESKKGMEFFLDRIGESDFKSVSYEHPEAHGAGKQTFDYYDLTSKS